MSEPGPNTLAIGTVLSGFASEHDPEKVLPFAIKMAGIQAMDQEVVDLINAALVERLSKWHNFYLDTFRKGWCHSGLPSGEFIAGEYFNHDLAETGMCLNLYQFWVETSLPKEMLNSLIDKAMQMSAEEGVPPDVTAQAFAKGLTEPRKSIFLASWNTPERKVLRGALAQPSSASGKSGCGLLFLLFVLIGGLLANMGAILASI